MTHPALSVRFYRTTSDREPVREWLRSLTGADRKTVGYAVAATQRGWPIGPPLVKKVETDLWELRVHLPDRIARVLFTVKDDDIVLLHGFIKKSQTLPKDELTVAEKRMKSVHR